MSISRGLLRFRRGAALRDRRGGVYMLFENAPVYQRILGRNQAGNRGTGRHITKNLIIFRAGSPESVIRNHGFSPVTGLVPSKSS